MEPITHNEAQFTIDFGEVVKISNSLLKGMEEHNLTVARGVAACCLTVGRLLAIEPLTDDQELKVTQAAIEWFGAYFAEGGAN